MVDTIFFWELKFEFFKLLVLMFWILESKLKIMKPRIEINLIWNLFLKKNWN
jgi:hypothetical protein